MRPVKKTPENPKRTLEVEDESEVSSLLLNGQAGVCVSPVS